MITPSFGLTATERVLPRLALDFTTASLDSRVTFTRSGGTASVVNSAGVIVAAGVDVPRFDYDPVTLACKGLLIEESRTNQTLQSENFSTSWTLNTVSASVDATISPDGTTNADKVYAQATTSQHYAAQSYTAIVANSYTLSVFAKADEETSITLRHIGATTFASAVYDLSGGTVSTVSGTASIKNFGNGWYRCILTGVADSTTPTYRINLRQASSYAGDDSSGAYLWGAQLEAGAFATSYIPTVASQVTRTADVATMTGTNFSDWYNAGAGGIVARVLPSTVSGTRPVVQFDDTTSSEVIALRGNTTNPELSIVDGGAPQSQIDAGTIAANTTYNFGAAWATDNCAAAVNGGASVTDTTATIPTVTQARLGSDGANYLNGQLQTVRYWPQRLIDAEVQSFSKG
jgi:hypothetical protein